MSTSQLGWLDIHGHFRLPETPEQAKQRLHTMRQGLFLLTKPDRWDPEEVLAYLDRASITMQMLSNIPKTLSNLQSSNDYGASLVHQYPSRFGLLAALPTNDPEACISEIQRMNTADGFAVTTVYNGVWLSDQSLNPVWALLNRHCSTVFIHPDAYARPSQGRPGPLIEVTFDTTRTIVDMLYNGVFKSFPDIRFVIAHAGGCVPVLSGRLALLGTEEWVPNPQGLSKEDIPSQLAGLYVDTAASAATALEPAIKMVGVSHCVYGSDCGVACSTIATMEENRRVVLDVEHRTTGRSGQIGMNGWNLFPRAAKRVATSKI